MKNIYQRILVMTTIVGLSIFCTNLQAQIGLDLNDALKLGTTTSTDNGTIRYTGTDFEGRVGGAWNSLTGGGSNPWAVIGNDVRYTSSGATYCEVDATSGGTVGYQFYRNGLLESTIWNDVNGNLVFTGSNSGSARHLVIDNDFDYIGINEADPTSQLHVTTSGSNGIRIEGNDTGDARLWITNGTGVNHFLFDDDSDAHSLKIQSSGDFAILTGGLNERLRIDNVTGDVDIAEELDVDGLVTTHNDVQMRGVDPILEWWNPNGGAHVGASIQFDYEGTGNSGELKIRNNEVAGEIEIYTSASTLNMRMNDTNMYAYTTFGPWIHKTTNLGQDGKAWDNVYYDDLVNQGAAAFVNRNVTEELLNFPPTEKQEGDFDYMTERGDIELDPNFLPPGLSEDNGILTDEMTTYNYKANFEQQQQINALKAENAILKAQIIEILARLND